MASLNRLTYFSDVLHVSKWYGLACLEMLWQALCYRKIPGAWLIPVQVLMAVCSGGFISFVCLLQIIKSGTRLNSGNSQGFCKKMCSSHIFLWRCHRLKIFKKFSLQQPAKWAVINVCVLLTIWLFAFVHNLVLIFVFCYCFFSFTQKVIYWKLSRMRSLFPSALEL